MNSDPLITYLATHDAPCPGCGYNLRGLQGNTCPECGESIDYISLRNRSQLRTWTLPMFAWQSMFAVFAALLLLLLHLPPNYWPEIFAFASTFAIASALPAKLVLVLRKRFERSPSLWKSRLILFLIGVLLPIVIVVIGAVLEAAFVPGP